jgi:ERCC4-type nuclease
VFPGTVLIDTREQRPFQFDAIPLADGADGILQVPISRLALPSGDYSLDGYATAVAVERKSVADLYGTVGQGRDRFVRELERLNEFAFAAVVIEGEWSTILDNPPPRVRLSPRSVYRLVLAWQQRFPRVHWWACPDRDFAEYTTFRILERFLKEQAENSFRKPKVK